ncbi:hypothetical protein SD70_02520 [Gordoniibacillus kamchatkensis]|uniref:Uncharacterized protein n=1 Tax=Gordoniibacillus kamchatkensis TaxID=1590651 RepID=A0ABR5AM09_9BACL|nr:hypothetical protein [Paenibacillus sp. VKM B-2647]KIL42077.1 hypothetical protein SD70_02520 [Paenibacillus sp. VKM B-2647]
MTVKGNKQTEDPALAVSPDQKTAAVGDMAGVDANANFADADAEYMPLRVFADQFGLKYGVELMAGFYHEQEKEKNFAELESVWHQKIVEFSKREVR